jgi:hypothetical protein
MSIHRTLLSRRKGQKSVSQSTACWDSSLPTILCCQALRRWSNTYNHPGLSLCLWVLVFCSVVSTSGTLSCYSCYSHPVRPSKSLSCSQSLLRPPGKGNCTATRPKLPNYQKGCHWARSKASSHSAYPQWIKWPLTYIVLTRGKAVF